MLYFRSLFKGMASNHPPHLLILTTQRHDGHHRAFNHVRETREKEEIKAGDEVHHFFFSFFVFQSLLLINLSLDVVPFATLFTITHDVEIRYCYDAQSQHFPQSVMARCFFSFFLFHLITSLIHGWHSHQHVFTLFPSCPSIPSIMVSLL